MKIKITLKQSRRLSHFRPILEGLVEDFGYIYYRAVLEWCGVVKSWDDGFWKVWLALEDGEVIGICGLYSLKPGTKELWLAWFGVIPSKRNKGRGAEILKQVELKAQGVGCEILRSYVDRIGKALPFYQRQGFNRICSVGSFVKKHKLSMSEFEGPRDHVIQKAILQSALTPQDKEKV